MNNKKQDRSLLSPALVTYTPSEAKSRTLRASDPLGEHSWGAIALSTAVGLCGTRMAQAHSLRKKGQ